jgi:hypothetical protein
MKIRGLRSWLMTSAGVVAFAASPALAQDAQQCIQQLDEIEQRIAQADVDQERRVAIEEVIGGARMLAEAGDEQGCQEVVAELEDLVQTVEADTGAAPADQQMQAQDPAVTDQPMAQDQQDPAVTDQPMAQDQQDPAVTEQPMAQDQQDPAVTEQPMAQDQPTDPGAPPIEDPAVAEDPAAPPVLDTEVTVVEPEDPGVAEDPAAPPVEDPAVAEDPAAPPVEDPAVAEDPAAPPVEDPAVAEDPAAPTDIGPLAQMPASDVIGADVVNAEGETIASVHDLVTGVADDRMYAVLRFGGFLGIGARDVAVDIQELDVGPDGEIVMAHATQEQLEQLPEYDETQYATREDDGLLQ